MKRKYVLPAIGLAVTLGFSLTACGGSPSVSATAPIVESMAPTTPSPSATQEGEKSPRGNIVKALGQPAGIADKDGTQLVNFTVNSITVDAPCTGPYPQPAENGHFTVLDVTVETTPELGTTEGSPGTFDINAHMFKFVGASGTTFNGSLAGGASYGCLPDEQMINNSGTGIGPAEKVTGKLVLDLPETTGVLVFKSYLTSGSGGWEWTF